jgi:hypothetical protein
MMRTRSRLWLTLAFALGLLVGPRLLPELVLLAQQGGATLYTGITCATCYFSGNETHLGAITTYNGATVTNGGVPAEISNPAVAATAQGANIAVTNFTPTTLGAGNYRVGCVEAVTRAATTSSTMPAVTIKWNNGVAQTLTLIASNAGNTTTTITQASAFLQLAAGQNITYDAGTTTGAFASVGGTTMQFSLYCTLEAL